MFVVHAVDGKRRWISGVFASRAAADDYVESIPADVRSEHTVISLVGRDFPLFIFEDEAGFRFPTEAEVAAEFERLEADPALADESGVFVNLYRVPGKWRPKKPGWDYMGALPHEHVTAGTLQNIRKFGFDSLWGRPAADRPPAS